MPKQIKLSTVILWHVIAVVWIAALLLNLKTASTGILIMSVILSVVSVSAAVRSLVQYLHQRRQDAMQGKGKKQPAGKKRRS